MENDKTTAPESSAAVMNDNPTRDAIVALDAPDLFTLYQERAAAAITALNALTDLIPDYEVAQAGRRRQIARLASIPDSALLTVAGGCETSEVLAGASLLTTAKVRNVMAFCDAFEPVMNLLLNAARGVGDTMAEKRAEVGSLAFRAVRIGKTLRLPDGLGRENLVRHLQLMEQAVRPARRTTKTERDVRKAVEEAKRTTPPLTLNVTTAPPATPAVVKFTAGRDPDSSSLSRWRAGASRPSFPDTPLRKNSTYSVRHPMTEIPGPIGSDPVLWVPRNLYGRYSVAEMNRPSFVPLSTTTA
jgi:hypothetical protein